MLDVLYLDNHLLVVNKPAGLPIQEDETGDRDLLSIGKAFIKKEFDKPGEVFLGLVHRLDRPVSGVVVFARTSKAASRLSEQFRARTPDKRYIALVEGRLTGESTQVDYLVKKDRIVHRVKPSYPKAQRAELNWKSLATDKTRLGMLSLVEVELLTGRPHQIRVQLSGMGHPVLGDVKYKSGRSFDGRNIALHSHRITCEHPTRKEMMTFTAPFPKTWWGYFDDVRDELGVRS